MTPTQLGDDVLRELLSALPDIVLLVSENRTIDYISRVEPGYEIDEVTGAHVAEFIAEGEREEHMRALDEVFETAEPATVLTEAVGPTGESLWYEGSMIPVVREGRTTAVAIITRNVTERQLAEQELDRLRSLLPVCAWCKKVRTEDGEWHPLEAYLESTSRSRITHGMCPECEQKVFGKMDSA